MDRKGRPDPVRCVSDAARCEAAVCAMAHPSDQTHMSDSRFVAQSQAILPFRRPYKNPQHDHPAKHDHPAQEQHEFCDVLKYLCAQANARKCSVERLLHDYPALTETEFYRKLAQSLDVPFLAFPVPLDPAINPHDALATGLAPSNRTLAPDGTPTFLYAPQGAQLDWIAKQNRMYRIMPNTQIAITTPTALRMSVRATFGQKIAIAATWSLPRKARLSTARSISRDVWILFLMGMLALLAASLIWSSILWHILLLVMTCFPVLPGLVIKLMALQNTRLGDLDATWLPDEDLPTYTVLVPVYREASVLPQLMASLNSLDYPRAKLDFKLLIEADDVETLCALETLHLPAGCDVVICPRGGPRTKPRALSIGLAYARSDFIVVYDAEDIPEPDQLKKAAAIFAKSGKHLACLQARLAVDNVDDSWLTRQFALEYAALFDVLLPGLAYLNQPIPLGGTSNHFRRTALQTVGAWDPWNVTEDADLGMRLFRTGYQVKTFNSTTYEEAPARYETWMNQRTRWQKGWMQTAIVHLRPNGKNQDRLTAARQMMLVLTVSMSPLSILFHPSLLFALDILIEAVQDSKARGVMNWMCFASFLLVTCASSVFDMMIAARGAAARNMPLASRDLIAMLPYSHLKTIAAWRGLFELLYAPYLWRKTGHGLSRTSRRNGHDELQR